MSRGEEERRTTTITNSPLPLYAMKGHSSYCKRNQTCRFNFPHPPSDETLRPEMAIKKNTLQRAMLGRTLYHLTPEHMRTPLQKATRRRLDHSQSKMLTNRPRPTQPQSPPQPQLIQQRTYSHSLPPPPGNREGHDVGLN